MLEKTRRIWRANLGFDKVVRLELKINCFKTKIEQEYYYMQVSQCSLSAICELFKVSNYFFVRKDQFISIFVNNVHEFEWRG